MNDAMTLERFQDLADAYGGVVTRWPDQERAAAMGLAAEPAALAILARASALDEALDGWATSGVPAALRDHVLAGLPAPKRSVAVRTRLWWSGIGVAAALAGAAAGTATVALVAPVDAPSDHGTTFGDVEPEES